MYKYYYIKCRNACTLNIREMRNNNVIQTPNFVPSIKLNFKCLNFLVEQYLQALLLIYNIIYTIKIPLNIVRDR